MLWARPAVFWLVFTCRIDDVHADDRRFGFTYRTLPDHPEEGIETFSLEHREDDSVAFVVSGESRSKMPFNRVTEPVGRWLQHRYTERYVLGMQAEIDNILFST